MVHLFPTIRGEVTNGRANYVLMQQKKQVQGGYPVDLTTWESNMELSGIAHFIFSQNIIITQQLSGTVFSSFPGGVPPIFDMLPTHLVGNAPISQQRAADTQGAIQSELEKSGFYYPSLEVIGTPWVCAQDSRQHPVLQDTKPKKITAAILKLYVSVF